MWQQWSPHRSDCRVYCRSSAQRINAPSLDFDALLSSMNQCKTCAFVASREARKAFVRHAQSALCDRSGAGRCAIHLFLASRSDAEPSLALLASGCAPRSPIPHAPTRGHCSMRRDRPLTVQNERSEAPGSFQSFDLNGRKQPGASSSFDSNGGSEPGASSSFDLNGWRQH
jgi:hypothetical protein